MLSNCAKCGSGFYGDTYGAYCCELCKSLDSTPELEERIYQLETTVDLLVQEIDDLKKIIKEHIEPSSISNDE